MGDTLITVIAIFLAAILMFVFPLMALSERTDDMAQLSVQTATTEFVDDVRTTGKLSLSDYEQFLQTITATGNAFDVELEIKHLDENPGQKTTQAEVTKIGENIYYNEYTSQIMDKLEDKGYIRLKEGDMFSTTVKNTNTTIAQQLRGFFYKIAGNENAQVAAKNIAITVINVSPIFIPPFYLFFILLFIIFFLIYYLIYNYSLLFVFYCVIICSMCICLWFITICV